MKTKLIKLKQWLNNRFSWNLANVNEEVVMSSDDLYSYVFWYNTYKSAWYAIPRNVYTVFFTENYNAPGVLKSSKMETLINIIEKKHNS